MQNDRNLYFKVQVHEIKRLANTTNGNARWKIITDQGDFITKADTARANGLDSTLPLNTDVILVATPGRRVWDFTVYDPTADRVNESVPEGLCPRCGVARGGCHALSRQDNRTYVCTSCGTDEAMLNFAGGRYANVWPGYPGWLDRDALDYSQRVAR